MYKKTIFTALMALALPFFAAAQEPVQHTIAIAVDKMNVIYAGLDNPLTIAINGHSFEDLEISSDRLNLIPINNQGHFNAQVIVKEPEKVDTQEWKNAKTGKPIGADYPKKDSTLITIRSKQTGKILGKQVFYIEPKPRPIAKIAGAESGMLRVVGTGTMKAQRNIAASVGLFGFERKCEVVSFVLYYTPKRGQQIEHKQEGGLFTNETLALIQNAKAGDEYKFVAIKALCAGDKTPQVANNITFKVL